MTLNESHPVRPVDPALTGQIVALIPVRSLTSGKSRLSGAIGDDRRADLIREMFGDVVAAATASGTVGRVIVVSPDEAVLSLAGHLMSDVMPLRQPADRPGLIAALDQGRVFALDHGAAALLILFGDLPLLGPDDVRAMVATDAAVVVSPDRHGEGTNALLLRFDQRVVEAGDAFRFQFGQDSFRRHQAEAARLGLTVASVVTAGTSLDVDTPADLAEWSARSAATTAH